MTLSVSTDYLGLFVGGLSQTGGMGSHTQHFGFFTNTVLGLKAIAGNGQQIVCSSTQETDLFNSLLGGLGQFGIIFVSLKTSLDLRKLLTPGQGIF